MSLKRRIILKLWNSLRNNIIIEKYYNRQRKRVLCSSYLISSEYKNSFLKTINNIDEFLVFNDDAEQETANFIYRHHYLNKILGAWRWKPLFLHKNDLIPIIFNEEHTGIDFGGGGGPVSLDTTIIDLGERDIFNRIIQYHSLVSLDFKVDYIFSSHVLEHIEDLPLIMSQFHSVLKPDGVLILIIPSYSCNRWRAGLHTSKEYSDHKWTFKLSDTKLDIDIPNILSIDKLVEEYFEVNIKEYSGDNCIYIFATKASK